MTDQTHLNYAAQITISLPDGGEAVTLTVTLWPSDVVNVDGELKALGDCTLSDLERYAAALEADVWDAYEAIVLPDLQADNRVQLEVKLLDEDVEIVEDWRVYNLLLPTDGLDESLPADEAVAPKDEDVPSQAEDVLPDEDEAIPVALEEDASGEEQDLAEPDVAVAESELVYPEIEQETGDESPPAKVIPSQARVRVAGKRLPLNDSTWAAVDIMIDEPALRSAQAHALSSLTREVAGVLVGSRPEKQPDGRYVVHIFDTIEARHTVMQGASVTYTPESWRYLNDTLAEKYPDDTAVMVGWYHTHPGFGVFLSGMDLFIHQNFFTQIWHVAMVLDPLARSSGFFCWDRHKSRVGRYDFLWPAWAAGTW